MLLKVSEELTVDASPEDVWRVLRDTARLASLVPGVESVTPFKEPGVEAYLAKAGDKIGPFKVALNMEIRIAETREPSFLKARLTGSDSIGLNRLTGWLQITLSAASSPTQIKSEAPIKILATLPTLVALPLRRTAT